MVNDRFSIIMMSPGGKSVKAFSFKTIHLKAFFALTGAFAFLLLLSVSINYLLYYTFENHQVSALQTKSDNVILSSIIGFLSHDIKNAKAAEERLKTRFLSIEESLLDMQETLEKKGIKKKLSIGGEFISPDKIDELYLDSLGRDIDSMLYTIKNTPVGVPLEGRVNSRFGYRIDPFNKRRSMHPGIDIDANYGAPIVATADGVVKKTGWNGGYGRTVVIGHKGGFETLYGHLSKITVKRNQKIQGGQTIGKAGSSGRSTGSHLHYEIRKNGKKINPAKFLSLK